MDPHDETLHCYATAARAYAEQFFGELAHKPFDRMWLDQLVVLTRGLGPVCDLGCGPGQVARSLRDRGADVFGADASEEMLVEARRLNPDIAFERQDMRALTRGSNTVGGIAAFYAIVHLSLDDVAVVAREMLRVLVPGGHALVTFHIGNGRVRVDDFLGHGASAEWVFFSPEEVAAALEGAGFAIRDVTVRWPYDGVEHASRRAYVLVRKPS